MTSSQRQNTEKNNQGQSTETASRNRARRIRNRQGKGTERYRVRLHYKIHRTRQNSIETYGTSPSSASARMPYKREPPNTEVTNRSLPVLSHHNKPHAIRHVTKHPPSYSAGRPDKNIRHRLHETNPSARTKTPLWRQARGASVR